MWHLLPLLVLPALLIARSGPLPGRRSALLWLTDAPTRPLEARVSVPEADVHRPYVRPRVERPSVAVPLRELARLEDQGDRAGIAASYLLHGDPQQALAHLGQAPASRDRDNDHAVATFLLARQDDALSELDVLLEQAPRHPQALWNRALVLREMGLSLLSASVFDEVAALGEPGWGAEAREQATTLRATVNDRAAGWRRTQAALTRLATDADAPISLEDARRHPGTARALFYEAVRIAPTSARVLALLPLAAYLDQVHGSTALTEHVRRVAARDFQKRAPLAADYTRALQHPADMPATLLQRLRASGEDDLLVGALLLPPGGRGTATELEALAQRWNDPWVGVLVQDELARQDDLAGESWRAGQRLQGALELCREKQLRPRCADLLRKMSHRATASNRLAEAEETARASWREAQAVGEWELESAALRALAQAARFQFRVASSRAYLLEYLARAPDDCAVRNYVYRNMAALEMMQLRPRAARKALDQAQACGAQVGLVGAWTLADLARLDPRPTDAGQVRSEVARSRADRETPGRRVLTTLIEARIELARDRAAGNALLRKTIAEAEPLLRTDADARDARAVAYQTMAVSAGEAGAFSEVPDVVAEQLGVHRPGRCALVAAMEAERTVVVALGRSGEVLGHHDASRKEPLGDDLSGLVPAPLLALLRSCPQVEVLAAPPLDSRAGLLPAEMAWSYRVGSTVSASATPTTPVPPMHLMVANVETPSSLGLARLSSWESTPAPIGRSLELAGAQATPSRVLEAMAQATDIEFHAHGVVDRSLSEAPVIALAPEYDGRYALTSEALRQVKLKGSPVVLLGACSAARLPPLLHQTSSLPQAFIGAGARAVFAATVDIPDSAGRFFQGVRERIHAGAAPAVALRAERLRWLREVRGAPWVTRVLLYE
ncbi:CHAT domain-containing protein [Myxococcus sp. K15C18031901]|uniref:CHAT domain-containing protein n=1 Tax=Myxococcus dinghuensis TaxID=2906761 RepID=UPI0020A7F80B|nr:CHAT domain-containing protein [Myxococcus dinghuensis]MCP3104971.1 CHAT domain-containing protein [Myxococcus dinghuensis]